MSFTNHAYIALGANIELPLAQLRTAVNALEIHDDIEVVHVSSIYKSAAYGNTEQDDFYNAVIAVNTRLSAIQLLQQLLAQEQKQGRVRVEHWGPRCVDLDLLSFNNETWCSNTLNLPHPEIAKRQFVLQPLAEIAPSFTLNGVAIDQLIRDCETQSLHALSDSLLAA